LKPLDERLDDLTLRVDSLTYAHLAFFVVGFFLIIRSDIEMADMEARRDKKMADMEARRDKKMADMGARRDKKMADMEARRDEKMADMEARRDKNMESFYAIMFVNLIAIAASYSKY
jgi:hypothetical protein